MNSMGWGLAAFARKAVDGSTEEKSPTGWEELSFRRRRVILPFVTCLTVFWLWLTGENTLLMARENAGPAVPKVAAIIIQGNAALADRAIRQVMLTRQSSIFSFEDTDYRADRFAGDVERVVSLYHSAGYYDAKVDSRVEKEGEDAVRLYLDISEGVPVRVVSLKLESPLWPSWLISGLGGKKEPPADSDVRDAADFPLLPLQVGDILNVARYNEAKKQLAMLFADHGYARVEVQGKNNIFQKEHQADVRLVILPGQQFMVGAITVKGNEKVADYLLLREMRLKAGDLFSLSKIIESRRRLHNLDLFSSVSIEPDWEAQTGNVLPLTIRAEEKPPRGIKLGAGYGTEDKLRALAQIRWRNFLRRGYSIRLTAKYSGLGHSLETAFEDPYFFGFPGLELSYFLGYEYQELESYQNDQYYSRVRLDKEMTKTVSLYAGHNFESNKTRDLGGSLIEAVLEKFGRVEEKNYLLSSLELGGLYNSVDDPISPTSGMSLSYSLEAAASWIGSEFEFLRQRVEWRGYCFPLDEAVFAFRLTGGTVDPVHSLDYIPISKRFFAGGSNSVRGYAYQDLGAKDQQGNPIGGYSLLEASAELRFPLLDQLKGVLFLDGGNIFVEPYQFDVTDLRYGAGFGFRYLTPVGPIRLDLAYKLNPEFHDDDRFRLHLNLGEAF